MDGDSGLRIECVPNGRKELIAKSPMADVKAAPQDNKSREYFVTVDETEKIIAECPDAEWRLIVALARYGGLRTPSETFALTLDCIDWERGRVGILSPKTECHAGREARFIPLFPELRPHLEIVFNAAEPGTTFVINRHRLGSSNLRTQLQRIMERAGVKAWPRLFQNMRASRETELSRRHPLHVVTSWIGNSAPIAARHYLQVTDSDFDAALERDADSDARATQIPTQQPTGYSGKCRQETTQALGIKGLVLESSRLCNSLLDTAKTCLLPPRGTEQGPNSSGKLGFVDERDADSDALSGNSILGDADLVELLHAWPDLSPLRQKGNAMPDYFFDIGKDDRGNRHVKALPHQRDDFDGEIRFNDLAGKRVSIFTALLIIEDRLSKLESIPRVTEIDARLSKLELSAPVSDIEARLTALEAIPRVTEVGSTGGRATAGQAPTPIKRMGRLDRCRFGYRPDPRDNSKLLPDKQEQDTIHRAQLLRSFGLPLREVCRRLDKEGRERRGKKWAGSHSGLRDILQREARVPISG